MQDIEKIYEEYSNMIYKFLFCLSHDDILSEDLTQETFVIAVKEIDKFKGDCKISTWLCQIAKHLWYKELKKRKKFKIEELDENLESLDNIEDFIIDNETKISLLKKMQILDEKSREIMYLRMIGNLNFVEIGNIMGKTANWARVTYYRAKEKMKEVDRYEK